MTRQKGYDNRSLAIADMIRDHLVEHRQKFGDEEIAGTITLVYDHHKPHCRRRSRTSSTTITTSSSPRCTCTWTITTAWKC